MTSFSISRTYEFESAHFLPNVPEGHKCKNMHGHHYVMEVTLGGSVKESGFIQDFWDVDKFVEPLIAKVDHKLLNDVPGLENPTAELIAEWFLGQISEAAFDVVTIESITVWETPRCKAVAVP